MSIWSAGQPSRFASASFDKAVRKSPAHGSSLAEVKHTSARSGKMCSHRCNAFREAGEIIDLESGFGRAPDAPRTEPAA